MDNACDCEALNPVLPADLAQKHVCAPAGVWLRFCACLALVTWYWLVSRALLRSRLWLVPLRPLSSPSSRVLSSWEALSSAFSTEPCANSSACDANHSLCWACSLQQQHTWSLLCPVDCPTPLLAECFLDGAHNYYPTSWILQETKAANKQTWPHFEHIRMLERFSQFSPEERSCGHSTLPLFKLIWQKWLLKVKSFFINMLTLKFWYLRGALNFHFLHSKKKLSQLVMFSGRLHIQATSAQSLLKNKASRHYWKKQFKHSLCNIGKPISF